MNVQKKEKLEGSLKLLMKGEEGVMVEVSFDKIQEQEQDLMMKEKFHQYNFYIDLKKFKICAQYLEN